MIPSEQVNVIKAAIEKNKTVPNQKLPNKSIRSKVMFARETWDHWSIRIPKDTPTSNLGFLAHQCLRQT